MPGRLGYEILYVAFIFFFCFFYTAVTFKPDDVADNMKKFGGYVPGIRPGKKTAEYIENVLEKLTFSGAILRFDSLRTAQRFNFSIKCSFLFWRHGAADCCRCRYGYGESN